MAATVLWVRFLGDDEEDAARPTLGTQPGDGAGVFELSDRARWLLAAVSLPRDLASGSVADDRRGQRLGSGVWSSGEIMKRIPYQHRSTLRLALGDLRAVLADAGLELDDHLAVDTQRGRYGLHAAGTRVDVVDLHRARGTPEEIDRVVASSVADPRRASLPPFARALLRPAVWSELTELVDDARGRARARPPVPDPHTPAPHTPAPHTPAPQTPAPQTPGRGASRRRAPALMAAATVLAAVVVAVVLATSGSRAPRPLGPPRTEVAGGVAHAWSDPRTAGGRIGTPLRGGEAVSIACRVRGFKVQDGDVWWYRIRSRPWSGRFYATADAFYNNGRTSGSLKGTLLVDPHVPRCR